MKIRYRCYQLRRALFGGITAPEQAWLAGQLSGAELRLFGQMPRWDQRHCLDVAQTLDAAGHRAPALLRAALLHDCGKRDDRGRPIPLLYYGLFVVLRRVAPPVYARAAASGHRALWPFAVHAAHEQRAVDFAATAGADPATLAVLRDYAAGVVTAETRLLGWADDQC